MPNQKRAKALQSLEKTYKVRTGHRKYVEQTIESVKELIAETEETNVPKLKQLKLTLKEELDIIKNLDGNIIDLTEDDEELFTEIREAGEFRDSVYEALSEIEHKIGADQKVQQTSNAAENQPRQVSTSSILPKLKLHKFNGEVTKWQTFWDSYKCAIHEDPSLNLITKFSYLRDLLEGSAASAIAAFQTTEANYASAIEVLQRRFGDEQVIVSGHHDALLNLPPLVSSKNTKELRNLCDTVEVHVRGLQALNVPTSAYGSLLVPVLLSKIPEDVRLLIGREIKDQRWELNRLIDLFREEVENRERCAGIQAALPSNKVPEGKKPANFAAEQRKHPSTAAALFTSQKPSSTSTKCTYCKQGHTSAHCSVVTDRGARKNILRQQGRCYVCLRKDHMARTCPSKGKCFNCAERHHVSICENRNETTPTVSNEGKPCGVPETNNLYVSARDNILLQTAQAYVSGSNHRVRVRVIFDSGSQRSFICDDIKDQLDLPVIGKESLRINVFGNDNQSRDIESKELVEFTIGSVANSFQTKLQAFTIPKICQPITRQNIQSATENFEYLKDLQLADHNDGESDCQISVLIGCDNIAKFFTGKMKRGEHDDSLLAQETGLGWVLSGRVPCGGQRDLESCTNFVSTHVLRVGTEVLPVVDDADSANSLVKKLWDLESIGIREKDTVQEAFVKNITTEDGKYCVKLPLKEQHTLLPDNYDLSLSRLNSLLKRLRRDPETLKEYDNIIQEQLRQGIIERVDTSVEKEPGNVHYLPSQVVLRKDALTTKLRVVYDASSKAEPSLPSLNDCLYTGPPMAPAIVDILLRFRSFRIGLAADIEKAFLNISVDKEQRDLMRFFWVDNIYEENPRVIVYKFGRVLFGMSVSPFY